jgi:hypothetical protein
MHWKIPFNWMDNGGPPTQVDNATTDQVATALGLHASHFPSIEALEQADWVRIIEKVFTDTQKWATKTNVLLDNKGIIKRCKSSCYTPKATSQYRFPSALVSLSSELNDLFTVMSQGSFVVVPVSP